ncbi:MAG: DUF1150 family protein [Alphaproteobacteria bacterium]
MTDLEKTQPLTVRDLAILGMQDVAYIRRVEQTDGPGYMIHAADGTPMAVVEDRDLAFAAVRQHGLEPVSVH